MKMVPETTNSRPVGRNKLAPFRHRDGAFGVGLPELRKLVPAYNFVIPCSTFHEIAIAARKWRSLARRPPRPAIPVAAPSANSHQIGNRQVP